ncbi:MAG: carboxypeptidase-like regulatory domain-containing protein [Vicinamibacterales bacterium]
MITGTATCATDTVAGLMVYVPGRAYTVITGANGTFQLDHVPAGSYSLAIDRGGSVVATLSGIAVGTGTINVGSVASCAATGGSSCGGATCVAPTPFCHAATETCVACLNNSQCLSGQVCTNNACVYPCGQPCTGATPVCNTVARRCVQCVTNNDCKTPPNTICASGRCGNGGLG